VSERPPDEGPLGFGESADADADNDDAKDERDRWAHRQDPDLIAEGISGTAPDRPPAPARLPPGASRYTWFVGVVAVIVLAYITINTISSDGPGSRGLEVGSRVPPFAAPLALSTLEGDVNIARKPNSGDAGKIAACALRGPDVLNVCQLYERGPVVLAFFATRGKQCTRELDTLERVRRRHPRVQFAAVAIRGDRGDVRNLIRSHGWAFPVGYDSDGILANLYGVAVCPQLTYVRRGGTVASTGLGEANERELERRVRALERMTRPTAT
jgi:hypothetical protein